MDAEALATAVAAAKELWPVAAGVGGGLAAWAKWRADTRKFRAEAQQARETQQQDLISIAQEVAGDLIKGLREEVVRLRKEVDALERELTAARKEHTDTVQAKDAELALTRGQLRQAWATIEALERLLAKHGIPHDPPHQPYFRVPPGDTPTDVEPL